MYFGEYERTVDQKGRFAVPAHMLTAAEGVDWSRVMIIKAPGPCLYFYELETWKTVLAAARGSMDDDESRLFMHRSLADAHLSDVDALKRVTIPAALLEHARIDRRAVVVGMFNRLELWEPGVWSEYLESMEDIEVPTIADLSRARIHEVS
jgi:MraZ protein